MKNKKHPKIPEPPACVYSCTFSSHMFCIITQIILQYSKSVHAEHRSEHHHIASPPCERPASLHIIHSLLKAADFFCAFFMALPIKLNGPVNEAAVVSWHGYRYSVRGKTAQLREVKGWGLIDSYCLLLDKYFWPAVDTDMLRVYRTTRQSAYMGLIQILTHLMSCRYKWYLYVIKQVQTFAPHTHSS